jgi:glycerol-1-phosphate dehydrogenase [NAD(P)+]
VPDDRIERALQKATDTRAVIVEPGALRDAESVLRGHFDVASALLVADDNTMAAAGRHVGAQLRAAGLLAADPLVFPGAGRLHPEFEHVLTVEAYLKQHRGTPVAVGSGVINDLVKLASDRLHRPYLCVATAASMDGYTAFAAAITHDGIKRVDPCAAPRVVLADVDVLAAAPPAMAASGYGDLLGKVVAGADWMIADSLGIEAIEPTAWEHSQHGLREWTGDPAALGRREPRAFALLIEGLLMAGLSMQAARSSRPASGSEHLFSHLWEMEGLEPSHGFKVGLGTLASAALADRMLQTDLGRIDVAALAAGWPTWEQVESTVRRSYSDPRVAASAVDESQAKYLAPAALRHRLERVRRVWPELQTRLRAQLLPAEDLRRMLTAAGCPVTPDGLGLTHAQLRGDYARARQIRSRYTLLDLAAEVGSLESLVASLFEPGGFWAEAPG